MLKASALLLAMAFAIADALVSRAGSCCFHLNSTMGPVGQLSDGQARVNQPGLPQAQFCIDPNGGLTDQSGRGCILTPPTTQFQCDTGAAPTDGFSVGCNGTLEHNHTTTFVGCPTGDNGGYNLYTTAPAGQQGCMSLTLDADGCKPMCSTASPCPAPNICPADLSGTYEYPHLIIPIDSANPNKAEGTSYNGTVSSTISSIFNFDIPVEDSGKLCSLVFLFPNHSQLQTSSYEFSGSGAIAFSLLNDTANNKTTYATAPPVQRDYGVTTVAPGHAYTVATFACPANAAISIEAKSPSGTYLNYFQDYNPAPIGLYITVC